MNKIEIDTATVGGRIKYLRKQMGMSQEELGWALDLEGKSAIYSYETNRRYLSAQTLMRLVKVLHTTPDYIMEGMETDNSDSCITEVIELMTSMKSDAERKAALEHVKLVSRLGV